MAKDVPLLMPQTASIILGICEQAVGGAGLMARKTTTDNKGWSQDAPNLQFY